MFISIYINTYKMNIPRILKKKSRKFFAADSCHILSGLIIIYLVTGILS